MESLCSYSSSRKCPYQLNTYICHTTFYFLTHILKAFGAGDLSRQILFCLEGGLLINPCHLSLFSLFFYLYSEVKGISQDEIILLELLQQKAYIQGICSKHQTGSRKNKFKNNGSIMAFRIVNADQHCNWDRM